MKKGEKGGWEGGKLIKKEKASGGKRSGKREGFEPGVMKDQSTEGEKNGGSGGGFSVAKKGIWWRMVEGTKKGGVKMRGKREKVFNYLFSARGGRATTHKIRVNGHPGWAPQNKRKKGVQGGQVGGDVRV